MANRFPLVLDTTDNNKIKEIQSGDNLNLTDNSIVGVQNITALGTINAADIQVNGNRLVAQAFADLTDTPASFIGSPNYFVKVKADGTGLEYRPLSDLGNIEIDTITVDTGIIPSINNVGYVGTEALKFNEIVATTLKGNLVSYNEEIVFNATTGLISYAALQGAPQFLSEFTNDVGYLQTSNLDTQLAGLFDEGQQFVTDIQGSVFGDDSTLLVDGVSSIITGNVLNSEITTTDLVATNATVTTTTATTINGPATGNLAIDAGTSGIINIGAGASTTTVNIENAVFESFSQGSGLGIAKITANTDLSITAGNRVRIDGGVPFRFASVTSADQLSIGAQEGDVIYNTTTSRLQMYQGAVWKDVNGNVEATTGTSNFNDVVIAGNLTITGDATQLETTNTAITDNVIILNQGEAGAGVTLGTSGIEIERGTQPNKTFVWDEATDKWTLGAETLVAATVEAAFTGVLGGVTPAAITGTTVNGTTITATTGFVGNVTGNAAGAHTGTFDGEVTGSVFGDDSTILVDGVNNKVVGNIDTASLRTSESKIALGSNAGTDVGGLAQGAGSIAIGSNAGNSSQNIESVAIGVNAGKTSQGEQSVAIGAYTAITSQGNSAVAIGDRAGATSQGQFAVALGSLAGSTNQAANSIVINATGLDLENTTADSFVVKPVRNQASANVAMYNPTTGEITHTATPGTLAANIDQATVAIGTTTATAINIGNALSTTTINGTVAMTAVVSGSITADDSISITTATGDGNAISIGPGGTNRYINLTADYIRFYGPVTNTINATGGIVGDIKGSVVADDSTVMIDGVGGKVVGDIDTASLRTSEEKIALGENAGLTTQGIAAVAIGSYAGTTTQGDTAVAIGGFAGYNTQGNNAVAVGIGAGQTTQGDDTVAVGANAGQTTQGANAVAIGGYAGDENQGTNAIAIGSRAGKTNQAANSIILNATGVAVENTTASSLVIKPIRSAVGTTMLMYDATSGEVTHSSTIAGTFDGDVTGSVFSDDSSIMVDAVGRTLASDLLTLSPLAAEPSNPVAGQLAVADGTGWDPAGGGAGKQQTVIYLGSAWVQIAIEA